MGTLGIRWNLERRIQCFIGRRRRDQYRTSICHVCFPARQRIQTIRPIKPSIIFHHKEWKGVFEGLRIDTCANWTSVSGVKQYLTYISTFKIPYSIHGTKSRIVRSVGGTSTTSIAVSIEITLTYLEVIIDVHFLVAVENIPTLLPMEDVVENGLDISIQDCFTSLGQKRHLLAMESFFLIHVWSPSDLPYVLYTEKELVNLHKTSGHPSIRALEDYGKKPPVPNRVQLRWTLWKKRKCV